LCKEVAALCKEETFKVLWLWQQWRELHCCISNEGASCWGCSSEHQDQSKRREG